MTAVETPTLPVKEIKKSDIEQLEKFANSNNEYEVLYNLYLNNATDVLFKRLKTYYTLLNYPPVKPALVEFKTLRDLETFIFDNKKWLNVSTQLNPLEDDGKREMIVRGDLDFDGLKKIARKFYPNLNAPYLDKALAFFRRDRFKIEDVLGICNKWVENKEFFKRFEISFESYQDFSDIKNDVENKLNVYLDIQKRLQYFPAAFKKAIDQEIFAKRSYPYNPDPVIRLEEEINARLERTNEKTSFYSILTDEHNTFEKIYQVLINFNRQYDLKQLKKDASKTSGASVVFKNEDVLVIRVKNFEAAKEIGTEKWCLSRNEQQWRQYVTDKKRNFYIVYNLVDYRSQMVGICVKDRNMDCVYNQNNHEDSNYITRNRNLIKALADYNEAGFKLFTSFNL